MKTLQKILNLIFKIVGRTILGALALFGIWSLYLIYYEIQNPHLIGNQGFYTKYIFNWASDLPPHKQVLYGVDRYTSELHDLKNASVGKESFDMYSGVFIQQDHIFEFPVPLPGEFNKVLEVAFPLATQRSFHENIPSRVVEIKFENISTYPSWTLYNPKFTGILDPYPVLTSQSLGLGEPFGRGREEKCMIFYGSNILDRGIMKTFPDCTFVTVPTMYDYPYLILEGGIKPLDETSPSKVIIDFHTLQNNPDGSVTIIEDQPILTE